MELLFLIGGLLQFFVFVFLSLKFLKHYEDESKKKIVKAFSILGVLYLIFSLSSFLWAFEILKYVLDDFLFEYSLFVFIRSLILFGIVYLFSRNKNLFFFLFLQLFSILSLFFEPNYFIILSIAASFLFSLLFFIDLIFRGDHYKNVGYFGIFYSSLGIIVSSSLFFFPEFSYSLNLILDCVFIAFILFFFRDLSKYKIGEVKKKVKEKSYFLILFSHLIFIITIVNFVFIGTIGIHEFGHFTMSKFYDCNYQKIVYENDFFHTEVLCSNLDDQFLVTLAGILTPLILALLLFILGGKLMKEISFLIAGFDLMSISKDLFNLGVSEILVASAIFLGILSLIFGILLLARSRIEEPLYLNESIRGEAKNFKGGFF